MTIPKSMKSVALAAGLGLVYVCAGKLGLQLAFLDPRA
jgi:hypothetical protein